MQPEPRLTGFAVFDENDTLLEANAAIFADGTKAGDLPYGRDRTEVVAQILSQLTSFDGKPVKTTKTFRNAAVRRWARADAEPVEAETHDGRWKLLTTHPRPGGGIALISTDITRLKQAEIAHRQQSEIANARGLLADAIESLSEGFALYDEAGRLVMSNRRYREMNSEVADILKPGLEWAELMRVSARRGVYRDAIGSEDEWVAERLRGGVEFIVDYELALAGGEWHSVSVHPTDLGGFVVTREDITERKQVEAAQREADEIVRQVLDTCPVPIQMSTIEDGSILYRNPAHFDLMGHKKRATDNFAEPERRQPYIEALLRDGKLERYAAQMVNAQSETFAATVSARLFEFQGKQVIVSVVFDETERIAAQNQLHQANERLTDAIESLSEGFALYGNDDCLVLANDRYRTMHAVSADVLKTGVNWFDFLRVTAERGQFPVETKDIDDWLAERARDRTEYRQAEFEHTDGNWYLVSTNPTREGGFVVTRSDITERKQAEAARLEADQLVRQVLEACPVNIQMTRASDGKPLYRSPATTQLLGDVDTAIDYYV
ncbi:MAG: PAS-domain containing protein, partial [Aestuariivirgaceae bacterium]